MTAKSMLLCATAGALCAAAAPSRAGSPTGFLFKSITVNKQSYPYTLYVPRNYDASKPCPLIMFLHGAGECGSDGWKPVMQGIGTAIMMAPEKWPFIVVIPQKPEMRFAWEQYDDIVMATLKQTQKDYKVDDSRLYLTGLSQGGHGTWVLGAKHADLWAAIAPICGFGGQLWPITETAPGLEPAFNGPDSEIASHLKNTPIWAFHGDADTTVPPALTKGLVDAVQAVGGNAKLTTYPGVNHNSWDAAYRNEDLGAWFLSHKRG